MSSTKRSRKEKRTADRFFDAAGFKTLTGVLFSVCFLLLLGAGPVFAAAPAKVKQVKAEALNKSVELTWQKAARAEGYSIEVRLTDSKKLLRRVLVASGETTRQTVSGLKNKTSYSFRIRAWRKKGSGKEWGKYSKTVSAVPAKIKLAMPEAEVYDFGESKIVLYWEEVDGAEWYEVSLKNEKTGVYEPVKKVRKKTRCTIKNTSRKKKYTFQVTAAKEAGGKTVRSKGCIVKASYITPQKARKLAASVNISNVNNTGNYDAGKVYSRDVAESYVNYGNNGGAFSSLNNYLVWVNLYTQRTFLFKRADASAPWKMVWSTPCITGSMSSGTPYGVYKFSWASPRHNYSDTRYAQYLSFFVKASYSVHTFMYPDNDEYENNPESFTKGFMGSEGCVRLPRKYARDIFNYCLNIKGEVVKVNESGSTIVIH